MKGSDRNAQSEMTVEERHPRNLVWPLKNKYGMSCTCGIQECDSDVGMRIKNRSGENIRFEDDQMNDNKRDMSRGSEQ